MSCPFSFTVIEESMPFAAWSVPLGGAWICSDSILLSICGATASVTVPTSGPDEGSRCIGGAVSEYLEDLSIPLSNSSKGGRGYRSAKNSSSSNPVSAIFGKILCDKRSGKAERRGSLTPQRRVTGERSL